MTRLRTKVFYASLGNASTTFALAGILVGIARIGTPVDVGRFSYALAIVTPLFLLAELRIRDLIATRPDDPNPLIDYFAIMTLCSALAFSLTVPACWLLGLGTPTMQVALAIGLWKTITAFSDVVYGYHQRNGKMQTISMLQILHCFVTVVTFLTFFALSKSLAAGIYGVFMVKTLVFLFFDLRSIATDRVLVIGAIDPSLSHCGDLFRQTRHALPLGLAGAVFAFVMVVPRQILEASFTLATVGVFSSLVFLARVGTPVMQAFGQSISSELAACSVSLDSKQFVKLLGTASLAPLLVGSGLTLASFCIGNRAVALIYGENFRVSNEAVVLVMMYATLIYLSTVLSYGLVARNRFKSQLVIMGATIAMVWVAGRFLIPNYEVLGACLALLIASLTRLALTILAIGQIVIEMKASHEERSEMFSLNPPLDSHV